MPSDRTLYSHRLHLVPLEQGDLVALRDLLWNPTVRRFLCDDRNLSDEELTGITRASQDSFSRLGVGLWWVLEQGRRIGLCGFLVGEETELLYVIHPDRAGRGFAVEAARAVLGEYQRCALAFPIGAAIDDENEVSHAVARRLGMQVVTTRANPSTGAPMLVYEWDPHKAKGPPAEDAR